MATKVNNTFFIFAALNTTDIDLDTNITYQRSRNYFDPFTRLLEGKAETVDRTLTAFVLDPYSLDLIKLTELDFNEF